MRKNDQRPNKRANNAAAWNMKIPHNNVDNLLSDDLPLLKLSTRPPSPSEINAPLHLRTCAGRVNEKVIESSPTPLVL